MGNPSFDKNHPSPQLLPDGGAATWREVAAPPSGSTNTKTDV